ncbi:MAG: hypothetical protein CMK89_05770 [Pseudomonadales bacterium]|nr:hypothetical protein [Pseudomonadales bacterium]
MKTEEANTILVTGANGLIGRWLVPVLLDRGYQVIAAMRQSRHRAEEFQVWVQQHTRMPFQAERLQICEFSLEQVESLFQSLPEHEIVAVYHLAAAYHWGLDKQYAHRVNVEASERLMEQVATLPNLKRFIWIGGYRVAQAPNLSPQKLYQTLGGYEASKLLAHQHMKHKAAQLNLPWTALHPSAVIGDSQTGETIQLVGIGELIKQLQQKKLPVLPGNSNTLVPLVHVDFVAEFAARILEHEEAIHQEYWLLDDNTPALPALIERIASHLSLKPPRLHMPVWILKRLPAFMLPGSKESLSFIAEDRYNIESTLHQARKMGIDHLLPINNLEAWVDQIAAM